MDVYHFILEKLYQFHTILATFLLKTVSEMWMGVLSVNSCHLSKSVWANEMSFYLTFATATA